MNSCLESLQFCPVRVRKSIASAHSSSLKCTSRANACKWLTRLAITSLKRAERDDCIRSITAAVTACALRFRVAKALGFDVEGFTARSICLEAAIPCQPKSLHPKFQMRRRLKLRVLPTGFEFFDNS
ncbi:MAG: hypothetical protein EBY76_11680 [Betaproteobacteria bacterium]|nr:hypothetical protein [Betaproteobacteria bacterium]NDI23690.1 hypothetical protein [Betaproteobacteria bacterium]